jgi:hypothetical protein
MLGPIDYIVVGFVGNNFDGSIMEELNKASYEGVIRVVDLMFIRKDANGDVALGEYQDQPRELSMFFEQLGVTAETPIFTEEDALKVAEDMDNDTAAGVLLIEHLWAKGLKQAIVDAGGFLIADGRIHPEKIEAAIEELEA